ncbi:hypothetical protein DPEC_G00251860 [Dallia pectoralis]|uniref:Uncharacterized protein n=1 Tax=Dallia pectoralis TaxID=75939 RepID=A0ACC2FTL7_DALPE|nr:hypothetical protein DPEC_G00251860 [Dallia pectoralis]
MARPNKSTLLISVRLHAQFSGGPAHTEFHPFRAALTFELEQAAVSGSPLSRTVINRFNCPGIRVDDCVIVLAVAFVRGPSTTVCFGCIWLWSNGLTSVCLRPPPPS